MKWILGLQFLSVHVSEVKKDEETKKTFRITNRELTREVKQNDRISSTSRRNCRFVWFGLATVQHHRNTTVVNTNPGCVTVCQTWCVCYLQTQLTTVWCVLKLVCWSEHVCDAVIPPSLWRYKQQKQVTETPLALIQDTAPSTWVWSWYLRGRKLLKSKAKYYN